MASRQRTEFEWDTKKDLSNREEHGVSFIIAQYAFIDPNRGILEDVTHSTEAEKRYYCLGKVDEGINRAVHVSRASNSDIWSRLLAKR